MKGKFLSCLLLIFLSAAPYLNTLKGSFVYDDSEMVLENRNVMRKTTLYQMFFDKQVMSFSGEIYRPLRDISYRIDYLIGGKEPFVYHLSNVLLHIIATLVAYWFLTLLFKGGPVPLLAAALFAVHPLHTESVAWVKGRDDILFTIFYLLSFGMYLKHENIVGWKGRLYLLASISLFILSLFSKELAVTLPLAIGLYQVIFKRPKFHTLLPFFIISGIYMVLRTYVLGQVAQQDYWGGGPLPTIFTMIKGTTQYVRLCFFPTNQCADYLFPISTGIDSGVVFSLSFLSLVILYLFRSGDKHILWGGLFFFISLLPVLNIVPIKAVIAERFLYLPLIGFCIVFASALCKMFQVESNLRIVSVVIVCFFSILAVQRSNVWNDEYSLWSDTIKKSPGNSRAHYGLGTAYASKGMMDKAIQEYKEAIRLAPYNPEAYNSLGLVFYKKGMYVEAASLYRSALQNDPAERDARYNLALYYHEQGKIEEAINEYVVLLRYKPDDFDALNSLGLALFQKGFIEKALLTYRRAMEVEPESVAPYNNIGMVYAVRGQEIEAEKWFKKALVIDPKSAEAYYNLGFMYQNQGRLSEAARFYEKAIEIRPDYEEARERLMEINN